MNSSECTFGRVPRAKQGLGNLLLGGVWVDVGLNLAPTKTLSPEIDTLHPCEYWNLESHNLPPCERAARKLKSRFPFFISILIMFCIHAFYFKPQKSFWKA